MTREIRLHFKPIYTKYYPMYCTLQCNNLPHENCNNLPQGGIFTRSTCQSNTHAHKAVIIPSIYTTGMLHFPTLSISRCSWIFFGSRWIFENVNKLLEEVKNRFLAITFSYCRIWSPNFACRVGLKCFSSDITENFYCLLVFEKTQL